MKNVNANNSQEPKEEETIRKVVQEEIEDESTSRDSQKDDCKQSLLHNKDSLKDDCERGLLKLSSV